jgi:hypothetical protein
MESAMQAMQAILNEREEKKQKKKEELKRMLQVSREEEMRIGQKLNEDN